MAVDHLLFVIGDQNDGKSVQLRSIFNEHPLRHYYGGVPGHKGRLKAVHALTTERAVCVRLSSPHESKKVKMTLARYERLIAALGRRAERMGHKRATFLGALQPSPANYITAPTADVVEHLMSALGASATCAFIGVNWHGGQMSSGQQRSLFADLNRIGAETLCVDARGRTHNSRLLINLCHRL